MRSLIVSVSIHGALIALVIAGVAAAGVVLQVPLVWLSLLAVRQPGVP